MPLWVHGITSKSSTSFPCVSEHGDSSRFIKNVLMRQSLSEVDRYYKVLCASKSSEVLKTPCMPDRECVGHLNTVFILIVSRGAIQKTLNGHAHSSLPWLFVARKKITSWRRQKLWKNLLSTGEVLLISSRVISLPTSENVKLSWAQAWCNSEVIDSKVWVYVGINRLKSIVTTLLKSVSQKCCRVE